MKSPVSVMYNKQGCQFNKSRAVNLIKLIIKKLPMSNAIDHTRN